MRKSAYVQATLIIGGISLCWPLAVSCADTKNADNGKKTSKTNALDKPPAKEKTAAEKQTEKTKLALWRGDVFRRLGQFDKAIGFHNGILKEEPNNFQALSNRGYCYARQQKYKEALADFEKALSINPQDYTTYYLRGETYSLMNEDGKAIKDFTKVLQLHEQALAAREARALSYIKLGQFQQALNEYATLLQKAPPATTARVLIGRADLYRKMNQEDKALTDYTSAIEKSPQYAIAYKDRAEVYTNQKRYQLAIEDYTQAIALSKKDLKSMRKNLKPLLEARSAVYQKLGNQQLAAQDLDDLQKLQQQ